MSLWSNATVPLNLSDFGNTTTSIKPEINIPGLNVADPLLSQIVTSKNALALLESSLPANIPSEVDNGGDENTKVVIQLLQGACDGDLVTIESILRKHPDLVNELFPTKSAGVSALVYAICFNREDIVETLVENHQADPDLNDTIVTYTPLMWAVYLGQLEIIKLLLNNQADPYLSPRQDGKNAISLINPERQEIVAYFKSHNLLNKSINGQNDDEVYKINTFLPQDGLGFEDDLSTKLKLHTISGTIDDEAADQEDVVIDGDDEIALAQDAVIPRLQEFDYDKLLPEEYIKFTDSDIPSLINYIFKLRSNTSYQHNTRIPAAILFQLVRYAHLKVESEELTNFLFDCFTARLRTVTNTKSGAFNMALQDDTSAMGAGDIVLLSYWLSSLQFLHFYFSKGKTYLKYPRFLQEMINLVQSLIATLSFSVNSRLNLLVGDCMLNFTSLLDVSSTLYAKDWNLFKNKKHPNNYDAIMNTLYPPTQADLMKPSPLRYIQVLGALDYVLKIHSVDNLIRIQTFSQVFYYMNCIIFNNIIGSSKYCTRSKAVQIRLNLSAIEDWLRSHNLKFPKPDTIGGLDKLIGGGGVGEANGNAQLHNYLKTDKSLSSKNPQSLEFYYASLYHVGKNQLQPTIELLQWLQCMSSLKDQESLINTINQFDYLNYYQLYKVANKLYKYEVEEPRLAKSLTSFLKSLMNEQGEQQVSRNFQHYMTQSTFLSKEVYVYLNPNYIFDVALPNLAELINSYGSGIGGVRVLRSKKYQPSLPISIVDDIDEIITENRNMEMNDSFDYEREKTKKDGQDNQDENQEEEEEEEEEDEQEKEKENQRSTAGSRFETIKGDELFKQVQLPNSLMHKEWGSTSKEDFETNPW
ncbi:uncharacterized protein LODBEIA_P26290 [Lodderomyces beijingensis]|uniref:Dilute domain-containing protein n=1 Tax=Lodderomyces beijingensis TaxID=1775926 RepID=A0ABP0ZMH9_9ASCO